MGIGHRRWARRLGLGQRLGPAIFPLAAAPGFPVPVSSSQFPVPSSQFPVPSSQFPVPSSQFPVPSSQFPVMSGRSDIKTVHKPWGHETIWAHTEQYVGKILHIKAGEVLSKQYHNVKDETVYLLSGKLIYRIWEGDTLKPVDLQIGQAYRITPEPIHRSE